MFSDHVAIYSHSRSCSVHSVSVCATLLHVSNATFYWVLCSECFGFGPVWCCLILFRFHETQLLVDKSHGVFYAVRKTAIASWTCVRKRATSQPNCIRQCDVYVIHNVVNWMVAVWHWPCGHSRWGLFRCFFLCETGVSIKTIPLKFQDCARMIEFDATCARPKMCRDKVPNELHI